MRQAKYIIPAVVKWLRRAQRAWRIFIHPLPMADAAQCVDMRAWAACSGSVIYAVQSKTRGSIAIFKDDIDACSDDWQLRAFVQARRDETSIPDRPERVANGSVPKIQ